MTDLVAPADTPEIKLAVLVDDEKIDQMIYRRVMERSGIVRDVRIFSRAMDALEFLKQDDRPEVDVVFLDINMPRMNGFEFLDAATREFGPDFAKLVVVMLTTSINPHDHDRATSSPVVRKFIYKPLTEEHVHEVAQLVSETGEPGHAA